jgi:hypothetical protein
MADVPDASKLRERKREETVRVTVTHPDTDRRFWSRDYWLGRCEGFRVDGPEGRVGVVSAVLGHEDEPTMLAVREGLFALRTVYVPIEQVAEVQPRAERIVLRSRPEPGP